MNRLAMQWSVALATSAIGFALVPPTAAGGGLSPDEAVRRMRVPEGFEVRLVAAEPLIRQPVSMSFDDRGRLWVLQYLQYPNPAGLKPVAVDQFLRTKYDRVPEPPPHGPKGADKLTILFDPDERGRFRQAKDFVGGLNLASGFGLGHGGVFVVQPPYLLFYPDRDADDRPDADPDVLLTGFGLEDAHATANSLQWGPDGWLYGVQGSTVTASIRGVEFQQGIWRYHPLTKQFELFAEGGGNTWGLDFDRHGHAIAGTNFGGVAMLHQVQGGYYVKNFGKHGALHNPHAYGYFDHVPYQGFRGGHVTCGGVLYRGGAFPQRFNGMYIAGNLLSNVVNWHVLERRGSSFVARHGGEFLNANDPWFRPIDCLVGPDGGLYVADWYDQRANHVDPVDTWDRTNGRVYKVVPRGNAESGPIALCERRTDELVGLLNHRNDWIVREARRLLAERRDPTAAPALRALIGQKTDDAALDAFWTLLASGAMTDDLAKATLRHAGEDIRAWTVRALGDRKTIDAEQRQALIELARGDPSATVRSQLAATCQRLPGNDALPILQALFGRSDDAADPHIPLQLWWAVERHALAQRDDIVRWFRDASWWRQPLVRSVLLERIGRRYLAEGGTDNLQVCAALLAAAPGESERDLLLRGMEQALVGRRLKATPSELAPILNHLQESGPSQALLRLKVRFGDDAARREVFRRLADPATADRDRTGMIAVLGEIGEADSIPVLLTALAAAKTEAVRTAALTSLQSFDDPRIPEALLALYPRTTAATRARIQTALAARPGSSLALLRAVDAGYVPAKDLSLDLLRRLAAFRNDALDAAIAKHYGRVAPESAGEKQARIRNLTARLREAPGDAVRGKVLFRDACATCHTLFGEGGKSGPELTGADRKNVSFLLTHIVDPSAVIRPEYVAYDAVLADGRSLFGLIAESSPASVTLLDAKADKLVIDRSKIESLEASAVSLMPEKLLDAYTDQQIRDLFAYLQADPALPADPAAKPPAKQQRRRRPQR